MKKCTLMYGMMMLALFFATTSHAWDVEYVVIVDPADEYTIENGDAYVDAYTYEALDSLGFVSATADVIADSYEAGYAEAVVGKQMNGLRKVIISDWDPSVDPALELYYDYKVSVINEIFAYGIMGDGEGYCQAYACVDVDHSDTAVAASRSDYDSNEVMYYEEDYVNGYCDIDRYTDIDFEVHAWAELEMENTQVSVLIYGDAAITENDLEVSEK